MRLLVCSVGSGCDYASIIVRFSPSQLVTCNTFRQFGPPLHLLTENSGHSGVSVTSSREQYPRVQDSSQLPHSQNSGHGGVCVGGIRNHGLPSWSLSNFCLLLSRLALSRLSTLSLTPSNLRLQRYVGYNYCGLGGVTGCRDTSVRRLLTQSTRKYIVLQTRHGLLRTLWCSFRPIWQLGFDSNTTVSAVLSALCCLRCAIYFVSPSVVGKEKHTQYTTKRLFDRLFSCLGYRELRRRSPRDTRLPHE